MMDETKTVKRYIGIDPGSRGAIAIIDDNDNVLHIADIDSDIRTYWYYIVFIANQDFSREYYGAVEDVCGRPGQSCKANTTFMKLAGYAELVTYLFAKDVEHYMPVKPQIWKKHFGLISHGLTKTERKHLSIEKAKELYPQVADRLTPSKDGRAEALLIARYCRDVINNNNNS